MVSSRGVEGSLSRITWRSHLAALWAILWKDWLHYIRYPMNAFFHIVEPIMWLVPIYFLGQSFAIGGENRGFAAYTGTTEYMSFVLLGQVLGSFVSAVFWGMGYALKNEMDSGVLESNWIVPLSRPLMLVGRTLASVTITIVRSAGVLLLAGICFGFRISGGVLSALTAIVPMLIALYGFGFAFAALILLLREPNTLIDISNFAVQILAGSRYPVTVLPRALYVVALALPLTYGYDAVRGFLLNASTIIPIGYEVLLLVIFAGILAPVGYGIFKLVERRCRKLGTLGLH